MSTLNAVDSYGRPNPAALKANNILAACRYGSYTADKNLTAAELADLHAAGIGVVANWEAQAGAFAEGAGVGAQHGRDALGFFQNLGFPQGSAVYASCDQDISGAAALPYMAAFKQQLGGYYVARAYSSYWVGEYLANQGVIDAFWQTYAWSGGQLSDHAVLYQFSNGRTLPGVGVDVDYNEIRDVPRLGAWWPADSVNNTPSGDEMSAAEVADLKAYMDKQRDVIVARVLQDLTGTKQRIAAFEPEILGNGGMRKNIRDSFCALGGQLTTLPDGTSISSIGAIFAQLKSAIVSQARPVVQQPVDLTAISAAAQAGAAKGINGATIHGGQT